MQVVSPPFSASGLHSFFTLLVLPLPVFKSCVQLLQHQQVSILMRLVTVNLFTLLTTLLSFLLLPLSFLTTPITHSSVPSPPISSDKYPFSPLPLLLPRLLIPTLLPTPFSLPFSSLSSVHPSFSPWPLLPFFIWGLSSLEPS